MNHNIDTHLLQETIDDLKNNSKSCTTYTGASSMDGTFAIPESNPEEQLRKFIQYVYDNDLIDQNYAENYKKIENKEIDEFTYEEVITGLTRIFRTDRFVSGELYSCVKNGSMLKLVERLYNLVK